jgi:hypothetical protein
VEEPLGSKKGREMTQQQELCWGNRERLGWRIITSGMRGGAMLLLGRGLVLNPIKMVRKMNARALQKVNTLRELWFNTSKVWRMMGRARVREPNRTALKTREKGEGEC